MPSFLDSFLTPLRSAFTKNVQPLFIDAAKATKSFLYDTASQDVKDQWGRTINAAQQLYQGAKGVAKMPLEFGVSAYEASELGTPGKAGMKTYSVPVLGDVKSYQTQAQEALNRGAKPFGWEAMGAPALGTVLSGSVTANLGNLALKEVQGLTNLTAKTIRQSGKTAEAGFAKVPIKSKNKELIVKPNLSQEVRKYNSAEEFVKNSKIKEPLYHGTNANFTEFDVNVKSSGMARGTKGEPKGIWFTNDKSEASSWGKNTKSVYADIRNPRVVKNPDLFNSEGGRASEMQEALGSGNDALIITDGKGNDWVWIPDKSKIIDTAKVKSSLTSKQIKTQLDDVNYELYRSKIGLSDKTPKQIRELQNKQSQLTDIYNQAVKKPLPVFKGSKNLTTKVLTKLKGRSEVSKQFISDLTNSPDLKQQERDLIRNTLDSMKSDKIPVKDFAKKVESELLPLKVLNSKDKAWMPQKYENISLPDELRGNVANYSEHIWESPIKTSAGDVHFPGQSSEYFGHTRVEEMAPDYMPGKKVVRITENQSDLYQKGRLELEKKGEATVNLYGREMRSGVKSDALEALNPTDRNAYKEMQGVVDEMYDGDIEKAWANEPELADDMQMLAKKAEIEYGKNKTRIDEIAKLQQYNNPTAHFRLVREEIKYYADKGYDTMLVPTGETAMKIEGLGQTGGQELWNIVKKGDWGGMDLTEKLTPAKLKTGLEVNVMGRPGGDNWIITDVLGDGKFKAVPKDRLDTISENILREQNKLKESFYTKNKFLDSVENTVGLPRDKIGGDELRNAGYSEKDVDKFYDELFKSRDAVKLQAKEKTAKSNLDELLKHPTLQNYTEQFDISGKVDTNNPIYKFYEKDLGRYLTNRHGAKPITDAQGVTWWEVDTKPEQGRAPVEAFGALPFLPMVNQDKNKQELFINK